jgi:hypothetical protein
MKKNCTIHKKIDAKIKFNHLLFVTLSQFLNTVPSSSTPPSFRPRASVSLTTAGKVQTDPIAPRLLFKWRVKKYLIFISLLPSPEFLSPNPPLNLLLSQLYSISPFEPNRDSPSNRGKQSRPAGWGCCIYTRPHPPPLSLLPPSAAAPSSSAPFRSHARCVCVWRLSIAGGR